MKFNLKALITFVFFLGVAEAADSSLPVLPSGECFEVDGDDLDRIGRPDQRNHSGKAIGRWTRVPYQELLSDPFQLGVLAFHANGIDRVEFSLNGGNWIPVRARRLNSQTQLEEFMVALDPRFVPVGRAEVRAKIIPKAGGAPRILQGDFFSPNFKNGEYSYFFYRLPDKWQGDLQLYVSASGSDSGTGLENDPLATIDEALNRLAPLGGGHVLLDAGSHRAPNRPYGHQRIANQRWITIRPKRGLHAHQVKIVNPNYELLRANVAMLRWYDVSIDFKNIQQIYMGPSDFYWFDSVLWYDSLGWAHLEQRPYPVNGRYMFTNGFIRDMLYALPAAEMVQNVRIDRISGDVFQNTAFVANVSVRNVNGNIFQHHTDLIQTFGSTDNMIVYKLHAQDLVNTQSLFFEPTYDHQGNQRHSMTNSAFVDLQIYNEPVYRNGIPFGGPPWSQMLSSFSHIVFDNLSLPNQRLLIRNDIQNNQYWEADLFMVGPTNLHWDTFDTYCLGQSPEGSIFFDCRRSSGEERP